MVRLVTFVIACGVCVQFGARLAVCQEVSFTPRYDGVIQGSKKGKPQPTAVPSAARPTQLYSLARFKGLFQEVCRLLDADGRRERVFLVVKVGGEEERECSSCRAFFKQMSQSCAPKPQGRSAAHRSPAQVPEQAQAVATLEPPVVLQRYPRTELLEVVSRLSEALYDFNPGRGAVLDALRSFERRLVSVSDLTPGERDYFGVFLAYLFSAWAGRVDTPLETPTPSKDEIARLFQ